MWAPFWPPEMLLTRDPRMVERKKPGQAKARKKVRAPCSRIYSGVGGSLSRFMNPERSMRGSSGDQIKSTHSKVFSHHKDPNNVIHRAPADGALWAPRSARHAHAVVSAGNDDRIDHGLLRAATTEHQGNTAHGPSPKPRNDTDPARVLLG